MYKQSDPAVAIETTTGSGHDLSVCDREPIHLPGAIQPHGMLLIVQADTGIVVGGAGDVEAIFGPAWNGRPVADLLGGTAAEALSAATEVCRIGTIAERGIDAVAFRSDDVWLVQVERSTSAMSAFDTLDWLDAVGTRFERAVGLDELCAEGAQAFRELTGFDRVMVYRFLDDDSGVVVAEAAAADAVRFRNHHFPASDIPRQARALYVRNRVRVIPDVDYVPRPILPERYAGIDLSDIDLRSVSPVHLQYLRNMGVRASASVSIVRDGVLWGLVACHHLSPRGLGAAERRAAQIVAGGLARQIGAKEQAEEYRDRIRVRTDEDSVLSRLAGDGDPVELLAGAAVDLRRMFAADSFAILYGDKMYCDGDGPDRDDVREVAEWVRSGTAASFHTRSLEQDYPPAAEFREHASGLLSVTLSAQVPVVLLWFRAEEREVVEWAGNPHKAVELKPGETLSPRASFAAWEEEVRGKARAWTVAEVEAAHRLQARLYEARQNRRIRVLADELGVAVADRDRLIAQKDTLLKEVNHRVQNSLQLVMAFLAMQARTEGDPVLTGHLDEAQRRLSAVALVHRRLYADDNVRSVDLARYLTELIDDLKTSMGAEWSDRVTLDMAPILLPSDDAIQVGLVLVELVINAQKYAYDGAPGPIHVGVERHRQRFRLIVADKGRGRSGSRRGFGSRMLESMVRRLGGTLDEVDNGPGLRMILSAPIAAAAAGRNGTTRNEG